MIERAKRLPPSDDTIARGDRVFDIGAPGKFGRVKNAGPEVSEIEWDTGVIMPPYVSNGYLGKVKPIERAKRTKQ